MGAALRGAEPVALLRALRGAWVQALPWIPVTLAGIALARRYPVTRPAWPRRLALHVLAALVLGFIANVLIVLGFWALSGNFRGLARLFRSASLWTTVNLHVALLIYGAVLIITQSVLYYRRARARELQLARVESQLARAQVQALTSQLRPHFLFNALHTIGQLWRSGRSDEADGMLDHLGNLFHRVERSTARSEVRLADELELVRDYLTIEEVRFHDRLRVQIQASTDALDCLVPPLILQPLVENAVRHGISRASDSGVVRVTAFVDDGQLRVTVEDDGPGMEALTTQPGSGMGLRNTRERLAQLFGPGEHLRVETAVPRGTRVTIDIPANGRRTPG